MAESWRVEGAEWEKAKGVCAWQIHLGTTRSLWAGLEEDFGKTRKRRSHVVIGYSMMGSCPVTVMAALGGPGTGSAILTDE